MGLRYASVRQPYVVVMAPALTETGQPQGFPLKPGTLTSPVSLITINESAEGAINYDVKCSKHLNFTNSTEGMNGDSKNFAKLQSVPVGLSSPCNGEQINKNRTSLQSYKNSEAHGQVTPKESDYSLLQIGGFMMNNSCTPQGEDDNMGLQKSNITQVGLSNLDSCNSYLKMDIFKNVGSGTNSLPQSDLGGGGDLGHHVEEIMQVIKNMESKGSDTEENLDSSLQINDGSDIAGGLSTFEREFFNDVVMMNMCVDENLGESSLAMVNKDTVIKDKAEEAQDRQFKIERKCEWLLRRLRKMQARAMGNHASEEITGILLHIRNLLDDSSKSSALYSALTSGKEDCEDIGLPKEVLLSSSSVSTLVRRLDQSSQQQALSLSQYHVPCKYFGSGSSENVSIAVSRQCHSAIAGSILPKLNIDVHQELDSVPRQMRLQFKLVECGIDSDVTASSSGGESCDEMQSFNNLQQQSLAISKRVSWRWSQDRAAIGSRWAWLQAQISDLEYRIRQTNDLQKQIRTAKGGVVLCGKDPPRSCDSVVVNGYHGALQGTTGKSVEDELLCESACRTRPLMRSSFRKRKLFQTAGLHLTSKKAAKPSTVPCGCRPPLPSCTLCTGRPHPTHQLFEDIGLLSLNERVALLDPAFHPVLSCTNDVSQSLHFDAIMKTADWQLKCHRLQLKSSALMRAVERSEDLVSAESISNSRPVLPHHQKRRYLRRNTSTAAVLSERLVPEEDRHSEPQIVEDESQMDCNSPVVVVSGATYPSPVPSPSPTPHCSKERGEAFRRKRENSYDIDNIVIPYSVAASTRLERLQYKEILTPKWRVHPVEPLPKLDTKNNNGLIRRSSQEDEEAEDMTEEMLVNRHERCEQDEKKKFSTYLKLPNSLARPRGNRRTDSRAESSGGNTPDPLSPAAQDGGGSPITSPPATPQPMISDTDCYTRRRTISSRCVSPAEIYHDEVAPYEARIFPLTDDTYEKMLKVMPPGHPFKAYSSSHHNYLRDSENESRPMTPLSDSTESADTFVEDDPNDPEWTVCEPSSERIPLKR